MEKDEETKTYNSQGRGMPLKTLGCGSFISVTKMFSNPLDTGSKKTYDRQREMAMREMKELELQIQTQKCFTSYYDFAKTVFSDQNIDGQAKMRLLSAIRPPVPLPHRDDTEKTHRDDSYPSRESYTNAIMESGINPGPYFQRALLQHSIPSSHFRGQFEPSQDIRHMDLARSQSEFSGRRVVEEQKEGPSRIPPRAVPSTPSHSDSSGEELSSRAYLSPQGGDSSREGYGLSGPRAGSGRVFLSADHDAISNLSFPSINGEGDNGEGDNNGDNHGDAN